MNQQRTTMEVGSTEWKGALDDEYERIISAAASAAVAPPRRASGTDDAAKEEEEEEGYNRRRSKTFNKLRDAALFKYIGVPVIMRDGEGDIIGMCHHRVDNVRHSTGLKVVPEGSV